MKKIVLAILLLTATISVGANEIRAVWLTTIGGIDWPHNFASNGNGVERQKREFTQMLDRLKLVGINTVLLQTRIRGTVIYPSQLEPWDGCMSGQPGRSPGYDPLRFAIDECHRRGMELHAWVVTIPLGKWNGAGCKNMRQRHPGLVRRIGEDGFLNPEMAQTGDVVAAVCREIAEKYNVDGIHLDYIRYPDGWKIKVPRATGRQHITSIVEKVNRAVKGVRRDVKMSCSPVGKYNDLPRQSSRGWNAYQAVCQDAQGWLRTGLMDQLYPMMYFRANQFFPFAIDWGQNRYGGDVAIGLGIYFLDPREGNWKIDEVKRQLAVIRQQGLGQCFFRAKFLLDNVQGLYDYLRVWNNQDLFPPRMGGYVPPRQDNGCMGTSVHGRSDASLSMLKKARYTEASSWGNGSGTFVFENDGRSLVLPPKPANVDADMLIVKSLTGVAVATLPYYGRKADISRIANGTYSLNTLSPKGFTHRLGFFEIRR